MFFTVHQPLNVCHVLRGVLYWLCAHCVLSYAFVNYMSTQSCLPLNFWWFFSCCCFHAIRTYQWYSHTCCYSSGHQTFKKKWKWHANDHFIAMWLPCHRLVMAISLPCQSHVTAFIALSLPCQSHAIAMVPNGILIFLLPSITCCWKLKIPSMCCKSGATTKEPKVMAAPKMVDTFTIRLSEASWRFSGTCMSYGSCICKMYWYYMIYHIDN